MSINSPPPRLPGTYLGTPAPRGVKRGLSNDDMTVTKRLNGFNADPSPGQRLDALQPSRGAQERQQLVPSAPGQPEQLEPRERAAQNINDVFRHEKNFPDLDTYFGRE